MSKKVIVVDFDGVLHWYTGEWLGAHVVASMPVPGAMDWLKEMLADRRFKIAIFSARSGRSGGIEAMRDWLLGYLSEDEVDKIQFPEHKPAGFLSIDDRAYCFQGVFPSAAEMLAFRPWNR